MHFTCSTVATSSVLLLSLLCATYCDVVVCASTTTGGNNNNSVRHPLVDVVKVSSSTSSSLKDPESHSTFRHHHLVRQLQDERLLDDCAICGDLKELTLPETTITVPTLTEDVTCQRLEEWGNTGNISSALCPLIQPLVQDMCGCQDKETTTTAEPATPSSQTSSGGEGSSPAESPASRWTIGGCFCMSLLLALVQFL